MSSCDSDTESGQPVPAVLNGLKRQLALDYQFRSVQSLPIEQQWECLTENPIFLRWWHAIAVQVEVVQVAVIYIYGWHLTGMSWLRLVPVLAYVVIGWFLAVTYVLIGPLNQYNFLAIPVGALNMYLTLVPLFQPVAKVCDASWQPRV